MPLLKVRLIHTVRRVRSRARMYVMNFMNLTSRSNTPEKVHRKAFVTFIERHPMYFMNMMNMTSCSNIAEKIHRKKIVMLVA
jgi:hypothetical protein